MSPGPKLFSRRNHHRLEQQSPEQFRVKPGDSSQELNRLRAGKPSFSRPKSLYLSTRFEPVFCPFFDALILSKSGRIHNEPKVVFGRKKAGKNDDF